MHNAISAHLISVQGLEYIVHFIVSLAYFYNKYVKKSRYGITIRTPGLSNYSQGLEYIVH